MRQVGRDALQLAGRQWRPPGSAPPRWRYVLDCSVEAPVTSQSSTMPPVRGHSREGPVVERLVAPCALCGCIHPLWFPRPTFVRIPVAGRKLPSPFHPRPSAKGRRRSALSIPWLCPGPRCPHARTASLRLAGCRVAASRSRHASAVTWPPTRPSALLFSFPTLHPLLHRAPALPIDGRRAGLLFLCAAYVQLYVYARTYLHLPSQTGLHRARADGGASMVYICTIVYIYLHLTTASGGFTSRPCRWPGASMVYMYHCVHMYCVSQRKLIV